MTQGRYIRWERTSRVLANIDTSLVATIQWLGRLDVQHSDEDRRFFGLSIQARATEAEMARFSDHYTMSYLWVLEAYKVLRFIDKCARNDRSLILPDLHQSVRETAQLFEKAQLSSAKKRGDVDMRIFSPVLNRKNSIGWLLPPDLVVTRQELSDTFLMLLERIQRSMPRADTDTRSELRTGLLRAIRFAADRNAAGSSLKGVTLNLSRSGICIIAFNQLKEGEHIRIEQGLNASHSATICWVKKLDKDVFKTGLQLAS